MCDVEIRLRPTLDDSKERLAKAFEKIEQIIEQKKLAKERDVASIGDDLRQKIQELESENAKFKAQFKEKYESIKKISEEVMVELDQSIEQIELKLKKEDGNS